MTDMQVVWSGCLHYRDIITTYMITLYSYTL